MSPRRPSRPLRSRLPVALLLLAVACAPEAEHDEHATIAADPPRAATDGPFDDAPVEHVYVERIAVFLFADSARLAALAAQHGEEDLATVGDDMMWYRAEAWQWLEDRGIPIAPVQGRPPLHFRVDGALHTYDFSDEPTLDLVVLYEPDRAPLPVPPIEVSTTAEAYLSTSP